MVELDGAVAGGEIKGTKIADASRRVGTVRVLAFDDFGTIEGITVEAREYGDSLGGKARGALVTVAANEHRSENAFIDADEIEELVVAFEKCQQVKDNPTAFQFFEIQYETRGGLQIAAFNDRRGKMNYYFTIRGCQRFVGDYTFGRIKINLQGVAKKLSALHA